MQCTKCPECRKTYNLCAGPRHEMMFYLVFFFFFLAFVYCHKWSKNLDVQILRRSCEASTSGVDIFWDKGGGRMLFLFLQNRGIRRSRNECMGGAFFSFQLLWWRGGAETEDGRPTFWDGILFLCPPLPPSWHVLPSLSYITHTHTRTHIDAVSSELWVTCCIHSPPFKTLTSSCIDLVYWYSC